jgi:nucleoside-diphosphate-sugar epimerase
MRVLVAGASGVIGRQLVKLLVASGHAVTGTTRSPEGAAGVRASGATPLVVDVFDASRLANAVAAARPEVVIHQLTDLPDRLDPSIVSDVSIRNARIRDEGTRNLVAAAVRAGARRLVAQSIAWLYAPGPPPSRG